MTREANTSVLFRCPGPLPSWCSVLGLGHGQPRFWGQWWSAWRGSCPGALQQVRGLWGTEEWVHGHRVSFCSALGDQVPEPS